MIDRSHSGIRTIGAAVLIDGRKGVITQLRQVDPALPSTDGYYS